MNLILAVSVLALATAGQDAHHDHNPQLGKVSFETTCDANANASFQRGVGWLHSFEYEQAARTFAQAAAADPRCGIAQWGVAMTFYHPLWAPPSAVELESGRNALAEARKAGPATGREQAYIAALESFYSNPRAVNHKARTLAYTAAMQQLHERYPQDVEAAVFYALSLIAAGTMDHDPAFTKQKAAGAILNRVLASEPDHPGVAHYLIHGFDYPELASLALPAARHYAAIAPDSPHAQHMPSHIFVRLGLWDEAIKSNLASEAASRAYAKAQGLADSSSERLHAMDYLAYSYLQKGQDHQAERVLRDLKAIQRADPPIFAVAYAATAIPARLTLERRRWEEAASLELPDNVRKLAPLDNFQWAEAHIHFARAVGAARSGHADAARREVAALNAIEQLLVTPPGTYDWRTQVKVERLVADAWLAHAEGRNDESTRMMRSAAALDDASEKHPVTPGAILPAHEQLGELLLEVGRPTEALTEYETALKRAPRRLASFYGAARAAKLAGNMPKARKYYERIVELTENSGGTRAEVREAKAFARGFVAR